MKPLCCLLLLSRLLVATASAQIASPTASPDRLAYEGLLAAHDGAPVADGPYRLTFRLYDDAHDSEARWQETQEVSVEDGHFAVELGAAASLAVPVGRYRLSVEGVGADGAPVSLAADDGLLILKAGTPSTTVSSALSNGIEMQGAEGHGLFVGRADQDGVFVESAGDDGVTIWSAGSPSSSISSSAKNGLEVRAAEGYGLYVGHAGRDGVRVNTADDDGIEIVNAGDIGVRVSNPTHEAAYLQRSINASASLRNHVVVIENTAETTTNGPDVLALQSSASPAAGGTNFITFFNGSDIAVGAVEGNGSGGVTHKSGGGDFAEFLPHLHESESLEAGDVVGVFAGRVTKATEGASRLLVVTDRAVVLGNMPPEEDEAGYAAAAFVGQVSVKVRGRVSAGDWLVASGAGDGTAVAVSPSEWRPWQHGPVVGRAWEAAEGGGVRRVLALVGLDGVGDVTLLLEQQQAELEALKADVSQLRALVEQLLPATSRAAQ